MSFNDRERLEESEEKTASLQVRLARTQKERDLLKVQVAALESDLRAAIDERDAMLKAGPKLATVRAAMLWWRGKAEALSRLEQAARDLVAADGMESETASEFVVLRELVRALPPEAA